ncbi:MAG: acyltransferase family protein, partial [Duncaniella sp.]|nr:acyltransferase family protein [Duncaniella sp.]
MAGEGRLKFIEYMQVIGIILVVAYHSVYMYPDGDHGRSLFLYKLIGTLMMPLFMLVSGCLMV